MTQLQYPDGLLHAYIRCYKPLMP